VTEHSKFILTPFSALFGAVALARTAMYRAGILRTHKINQPIISIGNLTTGGTGKTPLVEFIARAASLESNRRVCILTRGYGRVRPHERVVVSDGENILTDARAGGDEPLLLAESLLDVGVAVLSDADRVSAARWANENLHSEIFILDDGFQHLRLARDLDIITIDATNPFSHQHLLPRGNLREPLRAIARADCIVITRADQARDITSLRSEISRWSGDQPVLMSRVRTRAIQSLENLEKPGAQNSQLPPGDSVAAFCALGNSQAFFKHLQGDGFSLRFTHGFPDHHIYTQQDADYISREAARKEAKFLLTTAKDAVKLRHIRFSLPCYIVEIKMEFEDQEELLNLVRRVIQSPAAH
jgi:tetraacyldisaccharide 4'-kinase